MKKVSDKFSLFYVFVIFIHHIAFYIRSQRSSRNANDQRERKRKSFQFILLLFSCLLQTNIPNDFGTFFPPTVVCMCVSI